MTGRTLAVGLWAVLAWQLAVPCTASEEPMEEHGQPSVLDVPLGFAPDRYYNPSLVLYGSKAICAIKHTDYRKIQSKVWWLNTIQICKGAADNVQGLSCEPFQPWTSLNECELDSRVRGGKVDSMGIGDTKLWVWPGKGVYAIFGHKPQRQTSLPDGSSRYCTTQLVYHQWLVQVWADPDQSAQDPWRLLGRDPLPLRPDPSLHHYPDTQQFVLEKNWMPWIYKDLATGAERVMVTYMVMPHSVWEILPSGSAVPRWETLNETLFAKFADFDVHGGPPVVWVPPALSASGEGFYLGVMHHIERLHRSQRLYRHFAFKFHPSPPFQVTAISDELPLLNTVQLKGRTSRIAFASGLHLDPASRQVHVTYGAADMLARMLTLNLDALESLFTGSISFRDAGVSGGGAYTPESGGVGGAATRFKSTHVTSTETATSTFTRSSSSSTSSSMVQDRIMQEGQVVGKGKGKQADSQLKVGQNVKDHRLERDKSEKRSPKGGLEQQGSQQAVSLQPQEHVQAQ